MDTKILNFCVLLTLLASIALLPINFAYGQQGDQEQLSSENNDTPVADTPEVETPPVEETSSVSITLQEAQSEDILMMVWSSKVAIESYFDACLSYPPGSVEEVAQKKSRWNRRNRKVLSSVDDYMQNLLKLTVNDLTENETFEARLAQLTEEKSIKIRDSISRSPDAQSQICGSLDETVDNATRDFLELYRSNRRVIRRAYN